MKRKLFFLAALLTAIVMNLHADTANIDLTSGHTTSGQIQVTYNLDANISIVITCPEANISNEGNQGTSFDAYSGVSSLAIKAAEGCKITAATLTFYSSMYTPGYDGVGFLPGSSTSGISNSDEYSYYSGSASEVVWKFTEMELPCILSKASVTYTKPEPACQIGTKKYESIAAAIAEVKAGETIQVIKDIQLDAVINVTSSTPAFTLDLNGHILDGSKLVNQSLLYNASTLSIIDSNPTATHAAPFDTIAGAIMTGGKGWKTVSDSYGGAIYNYNNGTLHVKGVAFVNNTADYGGGVYSYQAASTFKNCRFYGNMGTEYGAALYINGNTCSIDSCVFQENASDCGILLSYKATIHVNGSTFVKDSATWGGAAYLDQSTSTFKNCRFNGNKSTQHGGAIYVGGNTCSIDSCVFQENASYCGIVYGNNQATVNVNGSEFVKNTATLGGAAYFYEATSVFKNCSFKENTAEDDGNDNGYGIVYCYKSQGSMDSCVVKDNNAKYGILYAMQASSLTIAHTTITGNSVIDYPGAVGLFTGSSLTMNDGTVITNNTSGADYQSAGVYVWNESGYTNTVAMSGKVIIKDNTTNGQPANLCLSGETHCDTIALKDLSAGSEVNVCTMINDTVAPVTFATNATEADLQYFVSDDGFAIVRENTNLKTKDNRDYLHFVSLKENCTVQLNVFGNPDAIEVEYSKDNRKSWNNLTFDTAIDFDNAGDTIWFRAGKNGIPGTNATFAKSIYSDYYYFAFGENDSIAAGGNTMSLLDATCELKTMPDAGFFDLFYEAKQLISAPDLPATTLAGMCYAEMFYGCANLMTAPDSLPADIMKSDCYFNMFSGCAKLKNAPVMKITQLAEECFLNMFNGCTSLQVDTINSDCDGAELKVPTTGAIYWNTDMFKGCHEYATTQLGGHYCISEWKGPRAVELKSVDSTRVYDGTPLVADSVIITGQMNRNNIQFTNFASQTNVGQQPNTFEYTLLMGSAADYAIDTVYGTLTVDFINSANDPIRVKIDKNEKIYDGEPLFASYSVEGGLAQSDSVALVMDTTELTESDYIAVKALSMQILRGDQVMNAGYVVAPIENGSLRVKAREVTLTSGSASKLYDGTPLTNNTVEESGDGFLEGHGATYNVTGTQTKIGVSDNKFTYTLNEGTDANNYNITTVYGVLAVGIKLEARIVPMYDGWNIVLDKAALEDSLLNYGVVVSLTDENVSWYHVMDDVDAFDNLLGVAGNDRAAVPFKGLFHTEDKAMDGQYYAVVRVDEALPVMGARFFRSNIVNMNAAKAAPYRPDGDKQGYDILGRPVHNGYQGIIIYNNGEKVVK